MSDLCIVCEDVMRGKCSECDAPYCGNVCHVEDRLNCAFRLLSCVNSFLFIGAQKRTRSVPEKTEGDPEQKRRAVFQLEQVLAILHTNPEFLYQVTQFLTRIQLQRYRDVSPEFRYYIANNGRFWFTWLLHHNRGALQTHFPQDPFTFSAARNAAYVLLGNTELEARDAPQERMRLALLALGRNDAVMQSVLRSMTREDIQAWVSTNTIFRHAFYDNNRFWYNAWVVFGSQDSVDPYDMNINYRERVKPFIPPAIDYMLELSDYDENHSNSYLITPRDSESIEHALWREIDKRVAQTIERGEPVRREYPMNEDWLELVFGWRKWDRHREEILLDESDVHSAFNWMGVDVTRGMPEWDLGEKPFIAEFHLTVFYYAPTLVMHLDYTSTSDIVPFHKCKTEWEWAPEEFFSSGKLPQLSQLTLSEDPYWPTLWERNGQIIYGTALDREYHLRIDATFPNAPVVPHIVHDVTHSIWTRVRGWYGREYRNAWEHNTFHVHVTVVKNT